MRGEDCPQTLCSFLGNLCHIHPSKEQCGPQIGVNRRVIAYFAAKNLIRPKQRPQISHPIILVIAQCLRQTIAAVKHWAPTIQCNVVVTVKIAKGRGMCLRLHARKRTAPKQKRHMVFIDQVRNHAPGLSEKHQNFPCVGQSQNAPIPEPADQIKRAATNQQTVPNTRARRPRHLEILRAQKP